MEITGRLTADAEVRKTKDKREVVSFTIAVNDNYKTKKGEWVEVTEFINCSYWISTKVADTLTKSSIVTVSGRIHLNQFTGKDGNHYAFLAFHVNSIKIVAKAKRKGAVAQTTGVASEDTPDTNDDLPF